MKTHLKIITSSLVLALTFVAPLVLHASNSERLTDDVQTSTKRSRSEGLGVSEEFLAIKRPHNEGDLINPRSPEMSHAQELFAEPRFKDKLPSDVMRMIFLRASDMGTNPAHLASVCNHWRYAMRQEIEPLTQSSVINTGKDYSNINNFMKTCMHRYWSSPIRNMQLIHTDRKTDKKTVMKIPAGADPLMHVFDSENPDIFKDVRITTSVDEFFKVKGDNENKLVILASTHGFIQGLRAAEFSNIGKWDPVVAPVGLFWRWGNWENLSWYDYLVTSSAADLSGDNLYRNWSNSICAIKSKIGIRRLPNCVRSSRLFHVSFLNSPKNN